MSDSYDPRRMAVDAMTGASPPKFTGVESFESKEGVYMLAEALEAALDIVDSFEGEDVE